MVKRKKKGVQSDAMSLEQTGEVVANVNKQLSDCDSDQPDRKKTKVPNKGEKSRKGNTKDKHLPGLDPEKEKTVTTVAPQTRSTRANSSQLSVQEGQPGTSDQETAYERIFCLTKEARQKRGETMLNSEDVRAKEIQVEVNDGGTDP